MGVSLPRPEVPDWLFAVAESDRRHVAEQLYATSSEPFERADAGLYLAACTAPTAPHEALTLLVDVEDTYAASPLGVSRRTELAAVRAVTVLVSGDSPGFQRLMEAIPALPVSPEKRPLLLFAFAVARRLTTGARLRLVLPGLPESGMARLLAEAWVRAFDLRLD